jgi:hypothetical protein
VLPPIKINNLIYIPMLDQKLTVENIVNLEPAQAYIAPDHDFEVIPDDPSEMLKHIPLLNHKSEIYDSSVHVRVRLLYHQALPIDLSKCLSTNIDTELGKSEYLKVGTYTKNFEQAKFTIK